VSQGDDRVEEWLEVGNGCICCSVKYCAIVILSYPSRPVLTNVHPARDMGVNAIEQLMERKGAFDYILLETTGLADPGNIAPLFWVDDGLGSTIYLDGIVTLVDAKNILKSLDEAAPASSSEGDKCRPIMTTAHLQISQADVVVINKSDLVSSEELHNVRARIEAINGLAKVHITKNSQVPQLEGVLLDLHAYDQVADLNMGHKGHSHLDPVSTEEHSTGSQSSDYKRLSRPCR